MMRKQLFPIALVAFLVGGMAWAGQKIAYQVMVNTSARVATGNLGTARNSADTVQRIGCFTKGSKSGTIEGNCYATNAQGVNAGCVTTVLAHIEAIRSISDRLRVLLVDC